MKIFALAAVVGATLGAPALFAQTLEARIDAARSGAVRMTYAAREGVCGNGHGFYSTSSHANMDWTPQCGDGRVGVQLEKDGAAIVRLRTHVGGRWGARTDVTDLGEVDAQEASRFMLDLAATAAPSVAEDAITAAVLADAPDPWQGLLALARDRSRGEDVRERATFWLGQSAQREATAGLADLVAADETSEMQKAAVFALSQRDEPERIDVLIRVARTHRNREVVSSAFFWLAESEDARAIDLFEEILGP
jgi:hypothetical protein